MRDIADFILNPFIFPIYFLGLWIIVSFTLSRMSGWASLKTKFRLNSIMGEASEYHSGSGTLEGIYCRGSLIVGATNDGLILKARFPFTLGHPPLKFPWSSIFSFSISSPQLSQDNFLNLKLTDPIKKRSFYAQYAEIKLTEFPELYLKLPWHEKLNKYLPSNLAEGLFNQSHEIGRVSSGGSR